MLLFMGELGLRTARRLTIPKNSVEFRPFLRNFNEAC